MNLNNSKNIREQVNSLYCKIISLNDSLNHELYTDYQTFKFTFNSLYRASDSLKNKN